MYNVYFSYKEQEKQKALVIPGQCWSFFSISKPNVFPVFARSTQDVFAASFHFPLKIFPTFRAHRTNFFCRLCYSRNTEYCADFWTGTTLTLWISEQIQPQHCGFLDNASQHCEFLTIATQTLKISEQCDPNIRNVLTSTTPTLSIS